jgi:hypothetical protein
MAKFIAMATLSMKNKCTSVVGHFYGHGSAPGQYRWHYPMRHVQGYLGSHNWTPPLGDYLLRITLAAARATGTQTTIIKYTYFAGRFDGHGKAPVRYIRRSTMSLTTLILCQIVLKYMT